MAKLHRRSLVETSESRNEHFYASDSATTPGSHLVILSEVGQILSGVGTFQEKAGHVAELVAQAGFADWVGLRIPDDDRSGLRLVASAGYESQRSPLPELLPYNESAVGLVYTSAKSIVFHDYPGLFHDNPTQFDKVQHHLDAGVNSGLIIPILFDARVSGVVSLGSRIPGHFTDERVALLEALAYQLGPLLENARLHQELDVIDEIARIITSTLDVDQVYDRFAIEVKKLMDFDRIAINILDHDSRTQTLRYSYGQEIPQIPIGSSKPWDDTLAHLMATTLQTVVRPDLSKTPKYAGADRYATDLGFNSSIALPLMYNGKAVATLGLMSRRLAAFETREQFILERMASHIAPAIENARLFETSQRTQLESTMLAEIGRIISSSLNINDVYDHFAESARSLIDFDKIGISLIDGVNSLANAYFTGVEVAGRRSGEHTDLHGTQAEEVLRTGVPSLLHYEKQSDLEKDFPGLLPAFVLGMRSFMMVPLLSMDTVMGVLLFRSKTPRSYSQCDVDLAMKISYQIAPAVECSQLYENLQHSVQALAIGDRIAEILTSAADINGLYEKFAAEMKLLVDFDRLTINQTGLDVDTFTPVYIGGTQIEERRVGMVLPLEGTAIQSVVMSGQSHLGDTIEDQLEITPSRSHIAKYYQSSISVPLRCNGQVTSTVHLQSAKKDAYGTRELSLIEMYADRIAPAIETARLQDETVRMAEENKILADIGRVVGSSLDIGEVYSYLGDAVRELIPFDRMSLSIIDQTRATSAPTWVIGEDIDGRNIGDDIPLDGTLAGQAFEARSAIILNPDTETDLTDSLPGLLPAFHAGLRSFLAVPLVNRDDVIAVLQIRSKIPRAYGQRHLCLADRIGGEFAGAVANSQLYEALQTSIEEMAVVDQVARIVTSTLVVDDVYEVFASEVRRLVEFDRVSINVIDPGGQTFTTKHTYGEVLPGRVKGSVSPLRGSRDEVIASEGQTLIQGDIASDPRGPMDLPSLEIGLNSTILVPLISNARVIGAFGLRCRRRDAYGHREKVILERLANQIAPAIENATMYEDARRAREDELRLAEENLILAEIGRIISSSLDIDDVYTKVTEQARKIISFDRMSVSFVDHDNDKTIQMYSDGVDTPGRRRGDRTPIEGALAGEVARSRSSIKFDAETEEDVLKRFPLLIPAFRSGLRSFISVPLIDRDIVTGVFQVRSSTVGAYKQRDIALVERIASQIGPAIENSRLYQDLKSTTEEVGIVDEVARMMTSTLDIDQVYGQFASEVRKLVPFDRLAINRIDDDFESSRIVCLVQDESIGQQVGDVLPLEGTQIHRGASTAETLVQSDVDTSEEYPESERVYIAAGFKSFADVPLVSKGVVIGSFTCRSRDANAYGPRERRILERLATRIAPALENARLYEQRQQTEVETSVIAAIGRIISSSIDIDDIYQRFSEEVRKLIPLDRIGFSHVDVDRGIGVTGYTAGNTVPGRQPGDVYPLQGTLAGEVTLTRRPMMIEADTESDLQAKFSGLLPPFRAGHRSFLAVPLVHRNTVVGVLQTRSENRCVYTQRHLELAERIANQIAGAIANAQLYEESVLAREEEHRLAQESSVIAEIGRVVSSSLDINEIYEKFSKEVQKLVPFDRLSVVLGDFSLGEAKTAYFAGLEVPERDQGVVFALSETLAEHVVSTRSPMLMDAATESAMGGRGIRAFRAGFRSFLGVPLIDRNLVIGVLLILSKDQDTYTHQHLDLAERIGNQIAGAIVNAELYKQTRQAEEAERQSSEELSGLLEVTSILNQRGSFETKVSMVMTELVRICDADSAALRMPEEAGLRRVGYGGEPRGADVIDYEGNIAAFVYKNKEIVVANDFASHSLTIDAGILRSIKSMFAAPIISRESVIGVVIINSTELNHFTPDLVKLVLGIVDGLGSLLETARSEARAAAIVRTAAEGIITIKEDGIIESVNPAALNLFGYDESELLGQNISMLVAGSHSRDHDRYISNYLLTGESQIIGKSLEVEGSRKDGTVVTLHVSVSEVDRTSHPRLFTALIRDLTERRRTEERLNETARLASIGELAAGVAHEINNPLTSVQGFSELVLEKDLPDDVSADVQTIFEEAQRAGKIVQNLLFFARRRSTDKQYMDVNSVITRSLEMKSYDFKVNNIEISTGLSSDLPKTMLDEHQLVQVFLNILTNAQHAIHDANGKGQISVGTSSSADGIQITINDDGPGVEAEVLGRIFEPFFTTKDVGEGTGLGLSIIYGIIKQHDGDIRAESLEGEGTTFHITLPVISPEDLEASDSPLPTATERTTKHILVVDDEPRIRDLLKNYLESERYTVDLAEDGHEAWRKMETMGYDCILLDFKMPGMSGPELYELIRGTSESLAKKVVFVTGDTVSPSTRKFLDETQTPVVAKPFRMGELLRTMNELWDNRGVSI